jgi:hypothetical protein
MSEPRTEYLIRAMRTAAVTMIAAGIAYWLLDDLATRRIEQEVARQRVEWERAATEGTPPPPSAMDLFDGTAAPAVGADQPDGECQHGVFEAVHPDPVALVREYVERDGSGQFLSESAWRNSAVACPEQLAAADQAAVVQKYAVRALTVGADTALVEVSYQRAGLLVQRGGEEEEVSSLGYMPEPRTEVDTFVVVRAGGTWRIHAPMIEQHVLPAAALRHFALPAADRARIEAIRS